LNLNGFDVKTVMIPHIEIRSTDIRERIENGLPIRHYVPDAVEEYIRKNEIYKSNR
jgi:nicotinate-nucleotide adenylyltransferase